ncbi:MAG: uracil-DNA glycosylase [Mariniblastus sp.]|nr:uracil-DNA glycosylase [Mariniblastus sp.]
MNSQKDDNKNEELRPTVNLVRQQLASLSRFGLMDLPKPTGRWVLDGEQPDLESGQPVSEVPGQAGEQEAAVGADSGTTAAAGNTQTVPSSRLRGEATTEMDVAQGEVARSLPSAPYPDLVPLDERPRELEILSNQVASCVRCAELSSCRTQTVFGVGNPAARLCFLGEGPGAEEDRQGVPFVGAAGQLLDKILEACRMRREDVYIMNCVKCRPPGNRNPDGAELDHCWPYAVGQLEILQPEFICCLGSVAAKTLLDTHLSIGRLRQTFHDYRGSRVMVTYHPAYLLRNPDAKKLVWDDMKLLIREMGI